MGKTVNKRSVRRRSRRGGRDIGLMGRRIAAALLVALAVVLAVFLKSTKLSAASLILGVGCALLLLEALLLSVNLPVSRLLKAAIGLLCAALLVFGFVDLYYARVDGKLVPRYALVTQIRVEDRYPAHFTQMESLETLDMRASTVTDFSPIYELTALKRLDVRDNHAFTRQEHDAMAQAQPGCAIRWSVPVRDTWFDSDQPEVDLTALPLSTGELRALFADYPRTRFSYLVPLLGGRYAVNTEALDLQGQATDVAAIEDALGMLPAVRSVDLRGVPASADAVAALCDAHPDIRFMFTCDVPGGAMTTEDASVTVTGSYEDLRSYMAYIRHMPNLERMDATAVEVDNDQADEIVASGYGGKVLYSLNAFGVKVSSLATELNLDGILVPDVESVEACLARLPNLKRVSMCYCGLSESDMGRLFDAHPDIKFVWWIEFGHYRLRTDATSFTTALGDGNRYGYDNSTFAPIRYCTDLLMLDLGHNHITSLESFKNLTKLRVLILADNQITDISDLAGMKDLEYVELFLNDITDLTPLADKEKLVDLNIFYNPIGDNYEVLKSMTWLKRLWIGHCRLSKNQLAQLRRALPKCSINVEGRGSTGMGWRQHPHYDTLKRMYEEERYIPFDD